MDVHLIYRDTQSYQVIVSYLFRIFLVTDVGYHCLGILTDLHEVLIEDSFSLVTRLEFAKLEQRNILGFLLLYLGHVEVGLAEELRCLELFGLLYVHRAADTDLCLHKVVGRLTTNPTGRHIRYLRCLVSI